MDRSICVYDLGTVNKESLKYNGYTHTAMICADCNKIFMREVYRNILIDIIMSYDYELSNCIILKTVDAYLLINYFHVERWIIVSWSYSAYLQYTRV